MKGFSLLIFLLLGFFCHSSRSDAGIRRSSETVWKVYRGDKIRLEVEVDASDEVNWFFEGQKQSSSGKVMISTGSLLPGEYRLFAVTKSDGYIDFLPVQINVESAPVLYKPEVLEGPLSDVSEGRVSRLNHGDWMAANFRGFASVPDITKAAKARILPPVFALPNDAETSVSIGSSLILNRVTTGEQILVDGRSKLKLDAGNVRVILGKAIWRNLNPLSGERSETAENKTVRRILLLKDLEVQREGRGDAFVEMHQTDVGANIEIFVTGSPVVLRCNGKDTQVDLSPRSLWLEVYTAKETGACQSVKVATDQTRARFGVMPWSKVFFGHWFGLKQTDFELIVRLDFAGGTLQRNTLTELLDRSLWLSVLDEITLRRDSKQKQDPNVLYERGIAFLEIGLFQESEKDFMAVLSKRPEDANAAFQLGRLFERMGKFKTAQYWYEKTQKWGFQDQAMIHRLQSKQWESMQEYRLASDEMTRAYWSEMSEAKSADDLKRKMVLEENLPFHGTMQLDLGVDSNVLPLDSKSYDLPDGAVTNRSYFYATNFDWKRLTSIASNMKAGVSGVHRMSGPFTSTLNAGAVNDHKFIGEVQSEFEACGFQGGVGLGTKLRGGERQTDAFLLQAEVYKKAPGTLQYGLELDHTRALDPAPKGKDILDARLNLIVPEGDHSYFETGVAVKVREESLERSWKVRLRWATLDFRRGSLDLYDGTEILLDGLYRATFKKRIVLAIDGAFYQRAFTEAGDDQMYDFGVQPRWFFTPRFSSGLRLSYGVRSSSVRPAIYNRQYYGVVTGYDF